MPRNATTVPLFEAAAMPADAPAPDLREMIRPLVADLVTAIRRSDTNTLEAVGRDLDDVKVAATNPNESLRGCLEALACVAEAAMQARLVPVMLRELGNASSIALAKLIASNGETTVSDAAELLDKDKTTISRQLGRLASSGLLATEEQGRRKLFRFTAEGKHLWEQHKTTLVRDGEW